MKKILCFLIIVLGAFMALNISTKHTFAWCIQNLQQGYLCPIPPPAPDPTISTSAPAPNTIKLNPPSTTWPDGGAFTGDKQPYFDVGNDTDYPKSDNRIPIYLRKGDTIDVTINNASPDCQTKDPNTGLYYPDYSTNAIDAGPPTTYKITDNANPNLKSPQTVGASANCSTTVTFNNIDWTDGDQITITDPATGQQKYVGDNGLSNSQYIRVVYLYVSVNRQATIKGENAFRVKITNTSQDSELASGNDAVGYGYREGNLSIGQHFTQEIVFGVDETCNYYDQNRSGTIIYSDMDAKQPGWNPNLRMVLQRQVWGDTNNWKTVKVLDDNDLAPGNGNTHTFPYQNFDNNYRYRLLIENVGMRNTIFIGINGDISQISGKYHISASDCSNFVCRATPIDAYNVSVTLTNKGPYPIGEGFQLRQSPNSQDWPTAASGFTRFAPGQSRTHKFTRPADATEHYTLYDGTGNNANVVDDDPLCGTGGIVSINCQTITVSNISDTRVTYTDSSGNNAKAGQIPIKLTLTGPGINQSVYKWIPVDSKGNQTATQQYDTFTTFGAWPHKAGYTITMNFVDTGDLSLADYSNSDPTNAYNASGNSYSTATPKVLNNVCVQATGCNLSVTPTPPEPGDSVTYKYSVQVTNQSPDSFPPNSSDNRVYDVIISASGGLSVNPPLTQRRTPAAGLTGIPPAPGGALSGSFSGSANYQGTWSIAFVPEDGTNQNLVAGYSNCSNLVTPQTKPYFQVWNSDVSAGGGFSAPTGPSIRQSLDCTASNSGPYISSSSTPYVGGIQAFGDVPAKQGAKPDFGAVAMGLIPVDSTNKIGLSSFNNAMFANTASTGPPIPASGWGTLYGKPDVGNGCVKDYYDDFQLSTATDLGSPPGNKIDLTNDVLNACPVSATGTRRCQFKATGPISEVGGPVTVPEHEQVTLFVKGDLEITQNIIASSTYNPSDRFDVPYLTIIVRGNLTIDDNVTRLDGLFITQPSSKTSSDGIFRTCQLTSNSCTKQLVIYGAVIAQRIDLLRLHGSVHPNLIVGNNPAEIINYTPAMVIGAPDFATEFGQPDGLFSLPPAF